MGGDAPLAVGQGAMQGPGAPRLGNPHHVNAANDDMADYRGPPGVSHHIRNHDA